MAVRPARRGPSGVTYALLFFVFLSLVGIGLSILFYSKYEEEMQKTTTANQELEQFATSQERVNKNFNAARSSGLEAKPSARTVFGELQTQRDRLAALITGTPESSVYQVEAKLRENKIEPGEGGVLAILATKQTEIDERAKTNEQNNASLLETQAKLTALGEEYKSLQGERERKVAELQQQIEAHKTQLAAYEQQFNAKDAQVNATLKAEQEKAAAAIKARDNEIKALNERIVQLELRIQAIIAEMQKELPDAPDLEKQPDGRVVSVSPGENIAYIDLGQSDHLVLGTTFEVFNADRGVEVGADGVPRGKATLEVVDIGPNSATAKIVRGSISRPVVAGDIIANLVYDRSRVFKFYVFGEFDLDGDRVPTLADHDMVVSLIRKWGGQVADPQDRARRLGALLGEDRAQTLMLPLDTDFLVIGQEPEIPAPVSDTSDPRAVKEAIAAKQKWEAYLKLRQEAQLLRVPILNQNRFLALIGYYRGAAGEGR